MEWEQEEEDQQKQLKSSKVSTFNVFIRVR